MIWNRDFFFLAENGEVIPFLEMNEMDLKSGK